MKTLNEIVSKIETGNYSELSTEISEKNQNMIFEGKFILLETIVDFFDKYPDVNTVGVYDIYNLTRNVHGNQQIQNNPNSLKKEFAITFYNSGRVVSIYNTIFDQNFHCLLKNNKNEVIFAKDVLSKLNELIEIVKIVFPKFYETNNFSNKNNLIIEKDRLRETVDEVFGENFYNYWHSAKTKESIDNNLEKPKNNKQNKL